MNSLAPVVVFAYRRPEHLRNTLTSLMQCKGFDESPVIIYCDGARDDNEVASVMATRKVAQSLLGDHAEYRFSETNRGLSSSVIEGITEIVERYGRVIVVEDDLQLSPAFLTFMNRALDRYADEERIFQVSGYQFDVPELRNSGSALFLPFTVSWGWATWKRAWQQFDPMAKGWNALFTDKNLRQRFNLDGAYDYTTMLGRQMGGSSDSWAIRWYWSVFRMNGLVLFPPFSLVSNTGFDGSGTHGRGLLRRFSKVGTPIPLAEISLPKAVLVDNGLFDIAKMALYGQNGGWIARIVDRIRTLFNY